MLKFSERNLLERERETKQRNPTYKPSVRDATPC
jgi:hypothetical protein